MTDPAPQRSPADDPHRVWSLGDYEAIASHLQPIADETVAAAGVGAGMSVLDVGVGSGNAAVAAARYGASVSGVDVSASQLDLARRRFAADGVEVELQLGDAESLPFADNRFNVVLSVLGMIFAPDHRRAAAEMVRVCRPGGTVAIASWADGGWAGEWRKRAAAFAPPSPPLGAARPDEWGDPATVSARLGAAGLRASTESRPFEWSFPSIDAAADLFVGSAGVFVVFLESLESAGRRADAELALRAAMEGSNVATDGTCRLPAPWVLGVGTAP